MCVLEVYAARASPLTNAVRQRLHDISSAERWTSRDHDWSKISGRRSALTKLELVRPDHAVFFPPCSFFQCAHPKRTTKRSREIHCLFVQLVGSKTVVLWRCACCCGMCSDSEISACDAGLSGEHESIRARTVWCNLKHICRSFEVFLSTRLLGWCLKHWIHDAIHRGLPHAVLTSENVCHVSFLPKQLVDLFVKTNCQGPNSTLCQRNDVRN